MAKSQTRQTLALSLPQFNDDQKLARFVSAVQSILDEVRRMQQLLAGGVAGQVLTKTDAADYDGTWGAAGTGPQGPPGKDGAPGTNGVNGANGVNGVNGVDGAPGAPSPPAWARTFAMMGS